jgi:hypothetical protein
MPDLTGIYDGGNPVKVGVLIFRISENESAPVDHIAYFPYHYREATFKYLKRLAWQKSERKTEQKPKEDSAAFEVPCVRSLQEDQKEAQPDA